MYIEAGQAFEKYSVSFLLSKVFLPCAPPPFIPVPSDNSTCKRDKKLQEITRKKIAHSRSEVQ